MVQSGGTVETSFAPNEETRTHQEIIYCNLVDQVAQINMVNCNMRATNAELKSELARYKLQEQRVEISQEKYNKLEKCYQKFVYQEQCLTRKINALHLSAKQITTLNDEISNLNKQLSKEKSSISSLIEEKKKLKHDFKTREDKFLDKEVDLEARIKDLENILLKRDQTEELFLSNVLNMVTVSKTISIPNENLSDDTTPSVARKFLNEVKSSLMTLQRVVKQIMTLVQNFETQFLQEAAKFVRDFKSLAKEADESLDKQKSLELEIKRLLKASVSHDIMSIVQNVFVDAPSDLQTELDPQLRDLKGKSNDTPSASNTLDPLNQKLESKIVKLEFQAVNYEREISHFKTTYKNLFDSIKSNRAHAKLYDLVYENAQLRARGFENTSESMKNSSGTSVTPHVDKPKLSAVTLPSKKLHALMSSHSVPQLREFNVVKHRNVTALIMPLPKGKTRNVRVPSASKSSEVKKNVTVEEHRRTLLLSKNQKTMSSKCNNIKLAIRNDKPEIVCANCKQCLVTVNHDACLLSSVNALNSRANKLCANVPLSANQKGHRTHVWKPKQVRSKERLA
nr:hypothetical protein [Tanacetum cinerariifolium]